jgi:MFS family permease
MATHQVGTLHLGCYSSFALTGRKKTSFAGPTGLAHQLSKNQDFGIKVAAPIGNLFGQLLFGWLADILGRKRMCKLAYLTFFQP